MPKFTKKEIQLLLAFVAFLASWGFLEFQLQRLQEQNNELQNFPITIIGAK